MKKMLMAVLVLAVCMALSSADEDYSSVFDFTLYNETGFTIEEIYVTAVDEEEWGDDVLGGEVVPDGESVDISFPVEYEDYLLEMGYDEFDLLVIDEDGDEYEYYGLFLEEINEITLKLDKKGKGVATWE